MENTLTLKHPVPLPAKAGEPAVSLTSITFRRPKAKDLAAIERAAKGGVIVDMQIAIIAALGDIPVEIAGNLDHEDYEAATEKTAGFFPETK